MSFLLAGKAFSIKVGNPARKLVLIKLAENANDKGVCWPSYKHIADQCEMSRRTVITHIEKLVELGLLKKFYRKGEKGNSSNQYLLTLDGEKSAPSQPSENIAPPPSEEFAPPSAGDSPPSENAAPPPSENAAPRTYHSFEPINEPVCVEPVISENSEAAHHTAEQSHPVHPVFQDSITDHRRQPMSIDWQPTDQLVSLCRMQRIDVGQLSEDDQECIIGEFRSYWLTRPETQQNQSGWEHKLAVQIKRAVLKTQATADGLSKADRRAAVSGAVMNISDTDW